MKTDPYIEASKQLITNLVHQIRDEDKEAYAGIATALNNGSMIELTTCLSMQGLAETTLTIVLPDGERVNIGHVEYTQNHQ